MQLFKKLIYPNEREIVEVDFLDFLDLDRASGIYSWGDRLIALNYGNDLSGNPPIRAILLGQLHGYLIDFEGKRLNSYKGRNLAYDVDKISEKLVFEGSIAEFIREFKEAEFIIN